MLGHFSISSGVLLSLLQESNFGAMKELLRGRNSRQKRKDSSGGKEKAIIIIDSLKKGRIAVGGLHLLPGYKEKALEYTKKFQVFLDSTCAILVVL